MSPVCPHAPAMHRPISVNTFREILEHRYTLACWCPSCRRWATCDLAMLVRLGAIKKPGARPGFLKVVAGA